MGSNHQTTNLVFPIFFPQIFLSLSSRKSKTFLLVQNSFFFYQFASCKRNNNKYLLEKTVDSKFVMWWFDPKSSLYFAKKMAMAAIQ